ncbi:tyrosine-type recombinase/integrase [Ligilactobacillus saerimneri]|uniref:tyrosine-type recombinase/integrase n=1 Tax=Ligilactobacillus saerimneri TaxID=228229 RepID=UPI0022A7F215|nr:site-specific integrase [Ligilactobacillus saerimneri]MCZ0891846.1 tyrosine-type recombinase/integrase [Ligilactobacillus saerimneri]
MSISIRKEKDGLYRGYVFFYDKNHKRRGKSAGKFKRKKDALDATRDLEKELDTSNINLLEISFADYYQRWYETYKKYGLAEVTSKRYRTFSKAIRDHFKDKMLKDVKRSDYQQFINWYGKNHSLSSVSKLNGAIRACVEYAIDDDIIRKDFTTRVKLVYNKNHERAVEYLNNNELKKFKDALVANINPRSTGRYMILTAIYTGMRKSEIQALTWSDIDFLHSTISITKSWDDTKKEFKDTKTANSRRVVPVPRELLNYLQQLKFNGSTMVFQNALGNIPTSPSLKKQINSILDDAEVPPKNNFSFHSLRHVHVAYLISKGVDIYAISKRLGHSDITITLKVYSYLIDEYKAKNDKQIIRELGAL